MKELVKKIASILGNRQRMPNIKRQKTRAQSMVEFAVLLPILLILFTGMVEFGFALNTYLSLIDATRQAARVYSNKSPFTLTTDNSVIPPVTTKTDDLTYYSGAAQLVVDTLNSNSYKIEYDSTRDNVMVSAVGVQVDASTTPSTITIVRHPTGEYYFSLNAGGEPSHFYNFTPPNAASDACLNGNTDTERNIKCSISPNTNTGLLIIEVSYSYEGTLGLPWVALFANKDNPMMLYASTVMPLVPVIPDAP